VDLVKSDGFVCTRRDDTERNVLGSSEMGIHFGKHLDLILRNEYRKRTREFFCILTKVATSCRTVFLKYLFIKRSGTPIFIKFDSTYFGI